MLDTNVALKRQARLALWTGALFGIGFFAWGALMPLDGAVSARGQVVLENNLKKIQHPTGGVVGELKVHEGMRVKEGDVLLRLDETATRANLAIIVNDLVSNQARYARLMAERDGKAVITVPLELVKRATTEADIKLVIENELNLFESRKRGRDGQRAQLRERIGQTRKEIEGLEVQKTSIEQQLSVANQELSDLSGLQKRGLVQKPRITSLEREIARNEGVLGDLIARVAQARGKISETELQVSQVDKDAQSEITRDVRETETKISELLEKRVAAEDQLRRIELRAPISGMVQQLTVFTVGGVVSPSEPVMLIVPDSDELVVEARLQPQDRDQLSIDQATRVRFTSFNQRTTPEVNANVYRISGDAIRDQQSGQLYYTVGVRVPSKEIARLNGAKLVPGMPVETFFKTSDRTLISFLLKPLTDHWQHAFSGR